MLAVAPPWGLLHHLEDSRPERHPALRDDTWVVNNPCKELLARVLLVLFCLAQHM